MEELKQSVLCKFIEKSCEKDRHEECARDYEGAGIRAFCICTCHDKKEKQLPSRESNLAADDIGRQLELGNFGSVADSVKRRRRK